MNKNLNKKIYITIKDRQTDTEQKKNIRILNESLKLCWVNIENTTTDTLIVHILQTTIDNSIEI